MKQDNPSSWKHTTPDTPGFHTIVTPENSPHRSLWFFRLNLLAGQDYTLSNQSLELAVSVIKGTVTIEHETTVQTLTKLDSWYQPSKVDSKITAEEDSVIYIGGAVDEGYGDFYIRRYDPDLPLGEIRQVHGEPPFRRDVFITCNQEQPGSRLITGLTWGEKGQWTSWPPHQHEKDLEEIYCYFDIPAPKFALHLSYCEPGMIDSIHPVSSGDCILVPRGYHPTVGIPGVRSCYFWVMAAHSHESRSYELSIPDPNMTTDYQD